MSRQAAKAIQAATCAHYGLDRDELLGRRRYGGLVDARHLAMYLCRERLGMSYPALGDVFGRDHSTVLVACQAVRGRLEMEPAFRRQFESLAKALDQVGGNAGGREKA